MAESSTSSAQSAPPKEALEEIAAAERLAADPDVGPALARVHIVRAWTLLHEVADSEDDLLSWSSEQVERQASAEDRSAVESVRLWALAEADRSPEPVEVFKHARVMRAVAGAGDETPHWFAWAGGGLVAVTIIMTVVSAIVSVRRGPTGPWVGEWYATQDFQGEVFMQRTRKIEFNWEREVPQIPGLGPDHWSVIWRTCMRVDEETEVRFRVSSDDGARLYVNGEKVVDNWGAHAVRTRMGKITLPPGAHYIRIDFFEATAQAEIKVLAAFGEEAEYETIPPSMLYEPRGGKKEPC
jgi:hypothetical protein